MSRVYLIKPLEKKSVIYHVEMFRSNADGSTSWFNIDETFRQGQGFIEEDMDCNLPYDDSDIAYCDPNAGWGSELEDSINCEFEFSDDLDDDEITFIKEQYYNGGAGWLFDGDHDWEEEDSAIHVIGPFQVSLCESDGSIIEQNVKLANKKETIDKWKNNKSTWPFTD